MTAERLLERGRQDDTKEAIAQRFAEYRSTTLPIINDFEEKGVQVHHISGEGTPEQVHELIKPLIKNKSTVS